MAPRPGVEITCAMTTLRSLEALAGLSAGTSASDTPEARRARLDNAQATIASAVAADIGEVAGTNPTLARSATHSDDSAFRDGASAYVFGFRFADEPSFALTATCLVDQRAVMLRPVGTPASPQLAAFLRRVEAASMAGESSLEQVDATPHVPLPEVARRFRYRKLAVAALVILAAAIGYWQYQSRQRSPFKFGELRAGMPFSDIQDAQDRGEPLHIGCTPVSSDFRICDAEANGPYGHITTAVRDGHVIAVQMLLYDSTPDVRTLAYRTTNEWDDVVNGYNNHTAGARDTIRYRTHNDRWSAEMLMRDTAFTPMLVTLRDEKKVAQVARRRVASLLVLARHGLADPADLAETERHTPGTLLAGADTLSYEGRRLALASSALPRCAPEPVLFMEVGETVRRELRPEEQLLLERSIPLVYPGHRLFLGTMAYLVDSAGAGEEIHISPITRLTGTDAFAYAISFKGRAAAVGQRARRAHGFGLCRAPAEIVLAHFDSAASAVTHVEHATLEHESLASDVTHISYVAEDDPDSPLRIWYSALYGNEDWYGDVSWISNMRPQDLRVLNQVPLALKKVNRGMNHLPGAIVGDPREVEARLVFMDELGSGVSMAGRRARAINSTPRGTRYGFIVMPSLVNGLPSGWTLLAMF
ncbi:MAG: hypothetical protein JWO05_807 [Gemmatimonadetes bacterium]|nr:hypothetical protein [Gemmatimonadota bacterium]